MKPETFHVCVAENTKYEVRLFAVKCGRDVSVTISGGTAPHIGAVSLAAGRHFDGSPLTYSAAASTIVLPDHKDDSISRHAAASLADALRATVCVSAGLHVDNASAEEIQLLTQNAQKACEKLIAAAVHP